jgi:hypothetical protein
LNSKILLAASLLIIAFPISAYALPGTISVDIDGTSVDISYDADGVDVIGIEADLDEIELIIEVQVTGSPAILELTFDRQIFDATFDGTDDAFFVIADGDFIDIEETETTSESRTLRLELPTGTEEIEIFGTELRGDSLGQPEVTEEPPVSEEPPVVIEEPPVVIEEPPVTEEPEVIDEKPKTECGPGTVLKGGKCVLELTCGPGTHLVGDVCVLDSTSSGGSTSNLPPMSSFIYGAAASVVISLIVMLILGIISRGSRQQTTN